MTNKTGWCMHDAGILQNDKLAQGAKQKFIQEIKDELTRGTAGVPVPPLPCGPKIEPVPFMAQVPLEDEKKFPEFHKNVLGMYEQIAQKLDAQSSFAFLPVCCPISLGLAVGADVPKLKFPDEFLIYGFALPLLAIKLGFDLPIDLALKFPQLLVPLPKLPPFDLPKLDFDYEKFPDLLKFNAALNGLPPNDPVPKLFDVIITLFSKIPELAIGILSFDLKPFGDAVLAAKPFGDFDPNSAIIWVVAMKILAQKTAECVLIRVVGTTLGSSSVGIVGGLGQFLGYQPPLPTHKSISNNNPRDAVVKSARSVENTSFGNDKEQLSKQSPDKLRLSFTSFLLPIEVDDGKLGKSARALKKIKDMPIGSLFARACLFRGGTTDDFYTKEAPSSISSQLNSQVQNKRAKIVITTQNFPKLKKGDIIICDNGSMVLTSDYSNGSNGTISGVFAGLRDSKNDDKLTSIKKIGAKIGINDSKVVITYDGVIYDINYAIDTEKMLKID